MTIDAWDYTNMRSISCWLTISVLVGATAGCSTQTPPKIRVEGAVTYRGQPVAEGTVSFVPLESQSGGDMRPAAGALQSDGTFCLKAYADEDGIAPGKYAVAIIASENNYFLPNGRDKEPVYLVPKRYLNPRTSGLTATVPAAAAGEVLRFDFTLQD